MLLAVPENPKLTILVDKREKRPLKFPPVMPWTFGSGRHQISRTFTLDTELTLLDSGDYTLKGYEGITRIERKGAVTELLQNLFTKDRPRFERSLKRLCDSCTVPILLLEMHPRQFVTDPHVRNPSEVRNELFRLCAWRGLQFHWLWTGNDVTSRLNLGLCMVDLMWSHVWRDLVRRQVGARKSLQT